MSPPVLSKSLPAAARHATEVEQRLGEPLLEGNQADVFEQIDEVREAILGVLDAAADHINLDASLLFAVGARAQMVECLVQQCRKGVRVQVMANAAQLVTMANELIKLRAAGATLNEVRPRRGVVAWLQRQYPTVQRQLAVVDGASAWCGPGLLPDGQTVGGPHAYFRGPIAQRLQRWFLETWHASGTSMRLPPANYFPPVTALGSLRMAIALPVQPPRASAQCPISGALEAARHDVFISMARRVPTRQLLRGVSDAAMRGVNVSVLLHDNAWQQRPWRRCCRELLGSSAWIYLSAGTQPLPAHCVVDGVWSSMALDGGTGWSSARVGRLSSLIVVGAGFAGALETACQTALMQAALLDAKALAMPLSARSLGLAPKRINTLLSSSAPPTSPPVPSRSHHRDTTH